MRRRLLKLGVFLLLGTIVNVAVAWGLVFLVPSIGDEDAWIGTPGGPVSPQQSGETPRWSTSRKEKLGFLKLSGSRDDVSAEIREASPRPMRFGAYVESWSELNERPKQGVANLIEEARGWPTLSLVVRIDDWPTKQLRGGFHAGDYVLHGLAFPRFMPLTPIWPGFAINTIFYAVLLWLLWVAPGAIRRYRTRCRRMREHRCLACNYQIAEGVGPNCSECGAKLPAKWSVKT